MLIIFYYIADFYAKISRTSAEKCFICQVLYAILYFGYSIYSFTLYAFCAILRFEISYKFIKIRNYNKEF